MFDLHTPTRATSYGMDSKTVKHIASLARIKLTDAEEGDMAKEMSSILGYIEKLNSVDTDSIEPTYQTTGLINSMREDMSFGSFKMDEKLNARLIEQSPAKEKRFVKVKSVLNK